MAVSQAEHATFVCGLEAAWAYVRRCRANLSPAPAPSPIPEPEYEHLKAAPPRAGDDPDHPPVELLGSVFDPTLLRRQMDTWLPFMMTHLSNEVDILSDEMMERVGQKGYDEFVVMLNKHLMSRDPTWHPCGAVASCQMDVVGRFMQMPYFVRRVMLPVSCTPDQGLIVRVYGEWRGILTSTVLLVRQVLGILAIPPFPRSESSTTFLTSAFYAGKLMRCQNLTFAGSGKV